MYWFLWFSGPLEAWRPGVSKHGAGPLGLGVTSMSTVEAVLALSVAPLLSFK